MYRYIYIHTWAIYCSILGLGIMTRLMRWQSRPHPGIAEDDSSTDWMGSC